jgi:tRNA dimethylallyltransferase
LVVGGTGLYVKALMAGLQAPAPPGAGRDEWEAVLERDGIEALAGMLKERAPDLYASLDDLRNSRRVMRALEMAEAGVTSRTGTWDSAPSQPPVAGLNMQPDTLNSAIEARVERMYAEGILDEMRELLRRHGELSATAGQAIGYGEAAAVLRGESSAGEARERTVIRTRRLAKRQRTWFRHQVAVRWIEVAPADATETTAERVMELWREHGPATIACE